MCILFSHRCCFTDQVRLPPYLPPHPGGARGGLKSHNGTPPCALSSTLHCREGLFHGCVPKRIISPPCFPLSNLLRHICLPGSSREDVRCPCCQRKGGMGRRSWATTLVSALSCCFRGGAASTEYSEAYPESLATYFTVGYSSTSSEGCRTDWFADGYCDDYNNDVACEYDGGDCELWHTCTAGHFQELFQGLKVLHV